MRELSKNQTASISGGVPQSNTPAPPVNGPTLVTAPNLTGSPVTLLNNSDYGLTGQIVKGKPTFTITDHHTGLHDTFSINRTGASDTFGGTWGNLGWGVTLTGNGQFSIDIKYSFNDTYSPSNAINQINGSYGYSGGYSGSTKTEYSHYA
ncbi:hypothetical protein [Metallibacterium sp.]|jgi:hypothetical protein|uniref:hypothetical protein n=1 Tax=Metallibacterium sp. TaxID=2940281 RepID=UPI0026296649|nr:hypothetical protein [Metallibacterium sp.]